MTGERKEEYWSRFTDTFKRRPEVHRGEKIQWQLMDKLSQEKGLDEIQELGCGAGFYTKFLAANCRQVMATDLSEEMLAKAQIELKELGNVTLEKADCEKTTFPDGRFDNVFMSNLVHVVENPWWVIRESHRILKDKGQIIIIGYTSHGLNIFEKIKLIMRYFKVWGRPPKGFHGYSPSELSKLVESAGFKVEDALLVNEKSKAIYLKARKITT